MSSSDPHIVEPGHSPTPFTADEIRAGCPPGRNILLSVVRTGEPEKRRDIRFVACNEVGGTQRSANLDIAGRPIDEPSTVTTTWESLQAHASFPAERTTITRETITTPLGELDCLRYDVRGDDSHGTYWFAVDLPGMPVRYTEQVDGEIISTVTMIDNS
jgi:hypothetical protein